MRGDYICEEGNQLVSGYCYRISDIEVLNDFISTNSSLFNESPITIGYQDWDQNKLTKV